MRKSTFFISVKRNLRGGGAFNLKKQRDRSRRNEFPHKTLRRRITKKLEAQEGGKNVRKRKKHHPEDNKNGLRPRLF